MINWFKKHILKIPISSERGSVLSMALVIIAVITFAATSVTSMSLNLTAQTREKVASETEESLAKVYINQAIIEFKDYVNIVGLESVDLTTYTPKYFVIITEISADNYDDATNGDYSRRYKFSFTNPDGTIFYKYLLISNSEFDPEDISVFDYTIGTNGKLYLNSGLFEEVSIFGGSIWLAGTSPYTYNDVYYESPDTDEVFPVFTVGGIPSKIYFNYGYNYCEATCFNLSTTSYVTNETNYTQVVGSTLPDKGDYETINIVNFFGDFNYETYATSLIKKKAPSGSDEITDDMTFDTIETVVNNVNNAEDLTLNGTKLNWPNANFVDITNLVSEVDFSKDISKNNKSVIYNGNLTLTSNVIMQTYTSAGTKTYRESLIVFGDLHLDGAGTQTINGTIIVTGDLYFEGDDVSSEGSFIVFGQTYIDFNQGQHFITNGQNFGLTIMGRDNIYILSHNRSNSTINPNSDIVDIFLYTERSIYIDGINSSLNYTGSLFARAKDETGNELPVFNDNGDPIRGIVINSAQGYINGSGNFVSGQDESDIRFRAAKLDGVYQERFDNIPVFENSLLFQAGIYVFKTSEFYQE
ncbi:MAG: hypothetical protein K9L74_00710 [Candidatus Izimaplasma sp.]|nr:hypothetical protein [Candidatus Izimaplasma bacterium]